MVDNTLYTCYIIGVREVIMKNKKNKTKNEEIFDKNLEVLSDENDIISEEDYYLADALAQDGQDIEEYAI